MMTAPLFTLAAKGDRLERLDLDQGRKFLRHRHGVRPTQLPIGIRIPQQNDKDGLPVELAPDPHWPCRGGCKVSRMSTRATTIAAARPA